MKIKALDNIKVMIRESEELSPPIKEKLLGELKEVKPPLDTDKWIYRMVVGALAIAVLTCLILTFLIIVKNPDPGVSVDIPEIFMAVGSAAVGALAGLLAPSRGQRASE